MTDEKDSKTRGAQIMSASSITIIFAGMLTGAYMVQEGCTLETYMAVTLGSMAVGCMAGLLGLLFTVKDDRITEEEWI